MIILSSTVALLGVLGIVITFICVKKCIKRVKERRANLIEIRLIDQAYWNIETVDSLYQIESN